MKHLRTLIYCSLFALAPGAAQAATAAGDCTGIQDHVLTPALFQRCLSPDASPVAGTAAAQAHQKNAPLRIASAAQTAAGAAGSSADSTGDAPKGLDVVKLSPDGAGKASQPPAPAPWGEAPYPQPGLVDAPLRLIDLQPVHFASNDTGLSDQAKQMLGRIAAYLQQQKGLTRVVLIGYSDHSGAPNHNYQLSQQRMEAVQAYLAARGIAPGLLHGEARGNRMPADESWTPSGQARNRRVEMYAVIR